ncbi:fasciclin domain-containing protein [Sphingobacterium sp. LRF_L2]|uniref:fasciclin domain-containing protein n=1 Tax=Sphingobacterium sp. LRF_L2 TaxID=3369421 RepID=UPI003F643420
MKRKYFYFIALAVLASELSSCRKDSLEAFYGRPDNLEPAIYYVLEEKGGYSDYLKAAEKAGYKSILQGQGYWTAFVPSDDAFNKYLQEQGYSHIDEIGEDKLKQIVAYSLVYNAFSQEQLNDYQSNNGWVVNESFRRRSTFYNDVYNVTWNGRNIKVLDANRNGAYSSTDNNNKYLSYFTSRYFAAKGLTAFDYNYFYPDTEFSDFNLFNGNVEQADIIAENGRIHTVNKVIEPPQSIDQYLSAHDEYSRFQEILNKYYVSYEVDDQATQKFQAITGENEDIYIKKYHEDLAFSPNNENYIKSQDNDGQTSGYTLFAPNNAAVESFLQTKLLKYYTDKNIELLPISIIKDFVNVHFWQNTVWPSKFSSSLNSYSEPARFNVNTDVVDKAILSNGFFYGTNKVQEANIFSTVYANAYLNPTYSLFTKALNLELKQNLLIDQLNYLVFLIPDQELQRAGFEWSEVNNTFQYTPVGGSTVTGGDALSRIRRLVATHIVDITGNTALDLSGKGSLETIGGEYINYDNWRLSSAGSLENLNANLRTLVLSDQEETINGETFKITGALLFTDNQVGKHIYQYAQDADDPYYLYYQYLKNSSIYDQDEWKIEGFNTGVAYTVFIPSNQAIQEAIKNGWLPGTVNGNTVVPNFTPTTEQEKEQILRFLRYHIVINNSIVPDGKKDGTFATLLKDNYGETVTVAIQNTGQQLLLTDKLSAETTARLILEHSNVLSNRTVIHQIDSYLKYIY